MIGGFCQLEPGSLFARALGATRRERGPLVLKQPVGDRATRSTPKVIHAGKLTFGWRRVTDSRLGVSSDWQVPGLRVPELPRLVHDAHA